MGIYYPAQGRWFRNATERLGIIILIVFGEHFVPLVHRGTGNGPLGLPPFIPFSTGSDFISASEFSHKESLPSNTYINLTNT